MSGVTKIKINCFQPQIDALYSIRISPNNTTEGAISKL